MIYILARKYSPRLSYIADIILGVILQTRFKLLYISSTENALSLPDDAVHINYSPYHIPNSICIPQDKLMFEEGICQQNIQIETGELLKIHFSDLSQQTKAELDFDIFAAAFYLITEYYNYTNTAFDQHGRYQESRNPLYANKHHTEPWINKYAEWLWDKAVEKNAYLQRREKDFKYRVTFDIDSPFLYKHKPFALQLGGLLKDVFLLRLDAVKKRLQIAFGAEDDPYNTTDYILQNVPSDKLIFFFLIDQHSRHDSRFTYKNAAYRKLIKNISASGIETGIHPSYTSSADLQKIQFEKEKLEEIIGKKIYASRMHFLKYRLPETYQYYIQSTLTHDYTSCPVSSIGFKYFIANPFLWFDLQKNTVTNLTINPTMAMDRTLQHYMALQPLEALSEVKKLIDKTALYNGHFVMLWHNSSLSEWQEWKGWRKVFEEIIKHLHSTMQPQK